MIGDNRERSQPILVRRQVSSFLKLQVWKRKNTTALQVKYENYKIPTEQHPREAV